MVAETPSDTPAAPTPAHRSGNALAATSLGLGAGAAATAALPYTAMIALPLAVVAVTLGGVGLARARQFGGEGRGMAIAGLATGGVGLLGVLAWGLVLFTGLGWDSGAVSTFSSVTAVEEGMVTAPAPEADEELLPDPESRPEADLEVGPSVEAGSGTATVTIDGERRDYALERCDITGAAAGRGLRAAGEGPNGRVLFHNAQQGLGELLLVVEPADEPVTVLSGRARSASYTGGARGGHEVHADGRYTDVATGDGVDAELDLDCE